MMDIHEAISTHREAQGGWGQGDVILQGACG